MTLGISLLCKRALAARGGILMAFVVEYDVGEEGEHTYIGIRHQQYTVVYPLVSALQTDDR